MKKEHEHIFKSLTDDQLMGLCIEREAGGESREGRIAVGTVILERVKHRKWDGETIQEVILKPWQFSWTMPECGQAYYNEAVKMASNWNKECFGRRNKTLIECYGIAKGLISGEIPRDTYLASHNCCQYMNPKTAEKGQKEKLLKSGMKVITAIGNHEFYV